MSGRIFNGVCMLILAVQLLTACSSAPSQQASGEFLDNSYITAQVKARLIDDPMTSGLTIRVRTENGVVQLSGYAATDQEKQRATEVASTVDGVKGVRNDLVVRN